MALTAFLERIGYDGPVAPGPDTLRALHRAWRRAVPYENLDIQLGRPIDLDPGAVFDKLVRRRRGGYCFEQNIGLAMLLRLAGFGVTTVEGGVLRETVGEGAWGNHSVLLVECGGERWVADAGIGDGFLDPLPLRAGSHAQGDLTYRLERLDPQTWRLHHHPAGSIKSYDFRLEPREIADFTARSRELSTSPDSAFVSTLLAGRPVGDHTLVLVSRTVRQVGSDGRKTWPITDLPTFADTLSEQFLVPLADLGPDGVERLWAKATAQDELWRARA